jgi:flagellar biosynthesis protein FlhF
MTMKMRRFQAATMREALSMVRVEFGRDAVILSSRRTEGGVEVVCASEYDPSLAAGPAPDDLPPAQVAAPAPSRGFQAVLARVTGARPPAEAPPAPAAGEARSAPPADPGLPDEQPPPDARPRVVWSQDAEIVAMRREVEALRRMLEYQLARLAWDDLARREPFRAKVLRDLSSLDIAPDLARQLAGSMPAVTNPENASRVALALLLRHLPVRERDLPADGGTFALVGPTGIGKTTTLAKLAVRFARQHGPASVGLISTDGYRVGAREQLAVFARVLGVPMKVAATPAELSAARRQLSDRRLVLVDTAGVGQRDLRLREQAALLGSQQGAVRSLLVLPANADLATLDETIAAHRPVAPEACIITKTDETATLGPVLSATIRAALPIAQVCDGPRVPDDLHDAGPRRVWLIRQAVKLRARTGRVADEQYLAEHFSGVVANG